MILPAFSQKPHSHECLIRPRCFWEEITIKILAEWSEKSLITNFRRSNHMFPSFKSSQRAIKTPEKSQLCSRSEREEGKKQIYKSHLSTWHGQRRSILPFKALNTSLYHFRDGWRCLKSVCHMFFRPFKWRDFFLSFSVASIHFFLSSFELLWKSFGAMLLYLCLVDSILFLSFLFLLDKHFRARHFCNIKTKRQQQHIQEEKVCKLFREDKKERSSVMWCFFSCFW